MMTSSTDTIVSKGWLMSQALEQLNLVLIYGKETAWDKKRKGVHINFNVTDFEVSITGPYKFEITIYDEI